MANMFVAEFGDLLATEDLSENNILPSPNKLLRKIILKGRAVPKKKVEFSFHDFPFTVVRWKSKGRLTYLMVSRTRADFAIK